MDLCCNTEKDRQRSHHRTAGIFLATYVSMYMYVHITWADQRVQAFYNCHNVPGM